MENVTLNFCIDGFGVSGQFDVDTGISKEDWGEMSEEEQDEVAGEYYHEHVAWGYEAK